MSAGALFDLPASPFWRSLAWGLSGLALLGLILWSVAPPPDVPPAVHAWLTVVALVCCALPSWRLFSPPCRLRSRASGWEWAPHTREHWQAGSLVVALDIGFGMLLRFDAAGAGLGWRRVWLAVDRRAIGSNWHALRCAVYSAPPYPVTDLPAERRHPSRTP